MASELRKLQILQNKLEDRNLFKTIIKNPDEIKTLSELEKNRKVESEEIINKLKNTFEFFNKISTAFQENNLTKFYADLNYLQTDIMDTLQNNKNLKTKIKANLQILQKQEDELCEEIETFNENCNNWDKPINDILPKIMKNLSVSYDVDNSINNNEEIIIRNKFAFKNIKPKKTVQPKKAFVYHAKHCEAKAKIIENLTKKNYLNDKIIKNKKSLKLTPEERLDIKKSIEQWKNEINLNKNIKQLENEIQTANEQKFRQNQANRMIKQFQVQDNFFLMKRKTTRKTDVGNKIIPKNDNNIISKRNPERIFQPTKVWIEKVSQKKSNNDETNFIPYFSDIRRISKLHVPEWRKNPNNQIKN